MSAKHYKHRFFDADDPYVRIDHIYDEGKRLQDMLNSISDIAFDPIGSMDDIRTLFKQDRTTRINRGEIG